MESKCPSLESLHLRGYRFRCHSYYDSLCRCKRIIVKLVPCAQLMRKQWTMSPKLHVWANFMDRRQKCLFGSRKVGCFLVLNLIFWGLELLWQVIWRKSCVEIILCGCHEGNSIIATALTSKSKSFIALSILPLFRGLQLGGGGFLTEAFQVAIELFYLSFFCCSSVTSLWFFFFWWFSLLEALACQHIRSSNR